MNNKENRVNCVIIDVAANSISLLVYDLWKKNILLVELYNFLVEIGFFHRFQSIFRPGDTTVMEMIYILNKIYNALDKGCQRRAVFLDNSKAFDKLWHQGLLAKLKSIGISVSLYNCFVCYPIDR